MSAPMTTTGTPATPASGLIPRMAAIGASWSTLGDGVAPLSNGSGRPLARTVKLILDPLVIRPVQNRHLAGLMLTPDAAADLADRIASAGEVLIATAEWFLIFKSVRRDLRITEGNPQEKYFQRCFELARNLGTPDPASATQTAAAEVQEIAQAGGDNIVASIRTVVQNPTEAARLERALRTAWEQRPALAPSADTAELIAAALDACGMDTPPDLDALVHARAGSAAASELESPDAARMLGLTAHERPVMPGLGETASTRSLPVPFDRSVFERLFAALTGSSAADLAVEAEDVLDDEVQRTAQPWELADEHSRTVMLLGVEASRGLEPAEVPQQTNAHRMLRGRWEREAYVRRVHRLPAAASGVPGPIRDDVLSVRQGYLRRLWVRLHGRELRDQHTSGAELWDTLDGVLRSVVMDQRHRLKAAIARSTEGTA